MITQGSWITGKRSTKKWFRYIGPWTVFVVFFVVDTDDDDDDDDVI